MFEIFNIYGEIQFLNLKIAAFLSIGFWVLLQYTTGVDYVVTPLSSADVTILPVIEEWKHCSTAVAVSTIPMTILQCSSSVYTVIANKFELSNEYEASALPDTSIEIKECCQFLRS